MNLSLTSGQLELSAQHENYPETILPSDGDIQTEQLSHRSQPFQEEPGHLRQPGPHCIQQEVGGETREHSGEEGGDCDSN